MGTMIQASKDKVKSFEEVQFRYIFRKTNTATYGIAQEGKPFESARSWIEEAPLKVKQMVASLGPFLGQDDSKEIPLSHEFILNRDLLAQYYPSFVEGATSFLTLNWSKYTEFLTFHGGLDPRTGSLWLTDIAHHH
ncbi:hypothetical protein Goshw_025457 [Gossypium schwendimanii]|uniref:Uncharacterized protein n=1 Tax=Gossypium schwendimanii TaxID=34291 RepID=A0A7J9MV98_GOSSC|nr:hypothetical protein [Gossypium schwendimanii]